MECTVTMWYEVVRSRVLNDFHRKVRAGLVGGVDHGTDGADGAPALANDEADVGGMQADAVAGLALAGNFADLDVVGVIDETAHHEFEEVLHWCARGCGSGLIAGDLSRDDFLFGLGCGGAGLLEDAADGVRGL